MLAPALEVPVHGAVVAQWLRQLMPVTAGAQAEDEAMEYPVQSDPAMAFGHGGVELIEACLDDAPYVVSNFPPRQLSCGGYDTPPGGVILESYPQATHFD